MALDLRKPHERYGSAYGTLIWQEGELFDKTGKLLPKDPQDLMNMGYRLPVPLRKRLFMYAHERRMDSELAARRKALEAEYQAMEQAFRDNLNKLSAAALSSEVVQPVTDYPPPPPPPSPARTRRRRPWRSRCIRTTARSSGRSATGSRSPRATSS